MRRDLNTRVLKSDNSSIEIMVFLEIKSVKTCIFLITINTTRGILLSLNEDNNKEIMAEIAQLCDKVIKI